MLITVGALVTLPGGFFKSVGTLFGLAFDLAAARAECLEGEQSVKGLRYRDRCWYIAQDQYLVVSAEGYRALRPYQNETGRPN